jgi:hypothetical protein
MSAARLPDAPLEINGEDSKEAQGKLGFKGAAVGWRLRTNPPLTVFDTILVWPVR